MIGYMKLYLLFREAYSNSYEMEGMQFDAENATLRAVLRLYHFMNLFDVVVMKEERAYDQFMKWLIHGKFIYINFRKTAPNGSDGWHSPSLQRHARHHTFH